MNQCVHRWVFWKPQNGFDDYGCMDCGAVAGATHPSLLPRQSAAGVSFNQPHTYNRAPNAVPWPTEVACEHLFVLRYDDYTDKEYQVCVCCGVVKRDEPKKSACECGAHAVGSDKHSSWCQLSGGDYVKDL